MTSVIPLIKKLLERVLSPLGVGLLILMLFWILGPRLARRTRLFAGFAFLALSLPSMPVVSLGLLRPLENFAPATAINEAPAAAAVVVLGGTVAPQWGESYKAEELAGSRLLTALRLYRLGKAPKILVTSGISYRTEDGHWRTEAEDMRDILVTMGAASSDIIVEPQAKNTRQNAFFSATTLAENGLGTEILLVSSALHLRRATLWFERAGMKVHPFGAGRSVRDVELGILDFVPSAPALARSTAALKEYLGLLVADLAET